MNSWLRKYLQVQRFFKYIYSGSSDESCRVWDVETGEVLHVLKKHNDLIRAVSISRDKSIVVTGCDDGIATIWSLETGTFLHKLRKHEHQLRSAVLTEDGEYLVTTDRLNNVYQRCSHLFDFICLDCGVEC